MEARRFVTCANGTCLYSGDFLNLSITASKSWRLPPIGKMRGASHEDNGTVTAPIDIQEIAMRNRVSAALGVSNAGMLNCANPEAGIIYERALEHLRLAEIDLARVHYIVRDLEEAQHVV